jgi:iron complex outermembrane receptor protein
MRRRALDKFIGERIVKIHALWLSASVLTLGWSCLAEAQTTAAATSPQNANGQATQEIVVTAERRSTNLQSTPIAATVLTGAELQRRGVFTVDQLQFVSPSLTVNNFGQGNDFDIRGIGKGEHNTQTGTGVVTYRDGVASFPGYFTEEPYFDIANVEVLRGPQGTFSGQNATGGAVIVNTQNPVVNGGYDGYVLAHYGNYNATGLQGAVNLPINDTLAARVAVDGEYRDSFYHVNGLTGDPNVMQGSARFSLLWTPTPSVKVLFKTDYDYLDNGGYFGDALVDPLTGKLNPTNHLFDFSNNFETYAVDQFVRSSLKVDYVDSNGITFRSVTGYQQGRTGWKGDIDGTNLPSPNFIIAEKSDETLWSQEFNIISPDKGPITWILGGYYQHNQYYFPPIFDIGLPPGGFDEDFVGSNLTHTYAGFGQVSFNLPAGFQLQAGLRYSLWSTTNHTTYFVPEFPGAFDQSQDEREHGNNLTGKVTLNWTLDNRNFLYVFVASGSKPGGLNTTLYSSPAVPIPAPFKQEYVVDYEIGWKSKFFDNHLRTQLGAYYNDFKNFQVSIPLPNNPQFTTELNNPNSTKLYGFEASAQAVFGDFSVNGGLGLEHSALGTFYTEDARVGVGGVCDQNTGPSSPSCINLKGHPQTYAPDFTFNISAAYNFKLASGDLITPSVNFAHISDQWGTLFDNRAAGDYLAARDILGASLAWTHGSIVTSLYGYNLNDDHYISAISAPVRFAGAPRQFGISVMKTF